MTFANTMLQLNTLPCYHTAYPAVRMASGYRRPKTHHEMILQSAGPLTLGKLFKRDFRRIHDTAPSGFQTICPALFTKLVSHSTAAHASLHGFP